jgi:hypothetical protein
MMLDGVVFAPRKRALPMDVSVFSSSPTPAEPTPVSSTAPPQEKPKLLPTPRAQLGEPRNQNIYARPAGQPQNLENALALLPTPTVSDIRDGRVVRKMTLEAMKRGASRGVNLNHLFESETIHEWQMNERFQKGTPAEE